MTAASTALAKNSKTTESRDFMLHDEAKNRTTEVFTNIQIKIARIHTHPISEY